MWPALLVTLILAPLPFRHRTSKMTAEHSLCRLIFGLVIGIRKISSGRAVCFYRPVKCWSSLVYAYLVLWTGVTSKNVGGYFEPI